MAEVCPENFPIVVRAILADPDASIAGGFTKIQIHRSTTGEAGPYAEITNVYTRSTVVSKQYEYVFEDTQGSPDYWYKFALYDPVNAILDTLSAAAPGEQDPALDILSIIELKTNYLFGVDLTNDQGEEMPPSLYAHYIKSAVDQLEQYLDIQIRKLVHPEERHDYYRDDYDKYISIALNLQPVISIESVSMVLPGEQTVQIFEKDWIHIQRESGQLQLLPGVGTAGSILLGASGSWSPLIYGSSKFIPDVFRVSYTSGFGKPVAGSIGFPPGSNPPSVSNYDPKLDEVPQKIKEVIGKIASFGPFNIVGDLVGGAGIASQSIGIDGLSQSFATTSSATNAAYGSRLVQYNKELKTDLPTLRRYWGRTALIMG